VLTRKDRIICDIQSIDLELTSVSRSNLFEQTCNRAAGATPGRPKKNQPWHGALYHIVFKTVVGDVDNAGPGSYGDIFISFSNSVKNKCKSPARSSSSKSSCNSIFDYASPSPKSAV